MATTNTVTEPQPGVIVYSFSALAVGDTFTFPGEYTNAKSILFQRTGAGTGASATTLALVGSLNGTNYAPLFPPTAIMSGFAAESAVQAPTENAAVWQVQPTRFLRLTASSGDFTGITAVVVIRTL